MSEQNYDCRGQMMRVFNALARELPVILGQAVGADVVAALAASAQSIAAWDLKTGGSDHISSDYKEMKSQLLRGFKAVSREANVLAGQGTLSPQDAMAAVSVMKALRGLDETSEKLAAKELSGEKVVSFGDGRRLQPGFPSLGQR